jgi:dihydroflavonol-4-reductase
VTSLVTGATGFLGRHLVESLAAEGAAVRILVRPGGDVGPFRRLGVDVVEGDVLDVDAVRLAASGCDRIFHLAGVVSHRRRDRRVLEAVNVGGTSRVLAAAEPGTRIVHVSSVAAIGPVRSPHERADEEHVFPPEAEDLPYAATKRAGESIVMGAAARGIDVVVANPGFLLGPGDVHRVSTWPVSAYLAGRLRFTTSGGLSFVDARDVAHGLIALAGRGRAGERTILAAEAGNLTWQRFFELLAEVSDVHRRMVDVPRSVARTAARLAPWLVAPDDVRAAAHWWFVTGAKAERELGFTTRPLAETIVDTIEDHASRAASSRSTMPL